MKLPRLWVRQLIDLKKNENEISTARPVVCLIFTGLPKQSERKESFCREMRLSYPWERIPRKKAASQERPRHWGFLAWLVHVCGSALCGTCRQASECPHEVPEF